MHDEARNCSQPYPDEQNGHHAPDLVTFQRRIDELENQVAFYQRQLAEQEERARMFAQLVSDYTYSYHIDSKGTIVRHWITEESFLRITGFTAEEVDVLGWENLLIEDDRPLFLQRLQAMREGQPDIREWRIRTRQGEVRWLRDSCQPIPDQEYGGFYVYGAAQDITDRAVNEERTARALEALLHMAEITVQGPHTPRTTSENQTQDLLPQARHVLELACDLLGCKTACIVTIKGEQAQFQPVAIVGMSTQDQECFFNTLGGYNLYDYLNDIQYTQFMHGQPVLVDLTRVPTPGAPNNGIRKALMAPLCVQEQVIGLFLVDYTHVEQIYPHDEARALITAISRLITLTIERERLLKERAQAEARELATQVAKQQMDDFLSMTSHELRTPLSTLKANLQLTRRQLKRLDGTETLEDVLNRIYEMLNRAERQVTIESRLIGDLLDVSRIQESRLELQLRLCNLRTIVQEVVTDIQTSTNEHTITIVLPEEEMVPVVVDVERIGQVLSNYLTNAIKYTPAKTTVEVRLELAEDTARVLVKDEGPGLPPEVQQNIWERFYQAPDRVTHTSSPGLGLGLYICQMIISQHQGLVGVESTPEAGATFWFQLPLAYT